MNYSYELKSGYFVSLTALAPHLKHMSHDDHQWGVVPIPVIFPSNNGEPRSFVLIGYSNPDSLSLLNALCFILPLVALGGNAGSEPELIVSFSSRSITALTNGLYMEDGEGKYDFFEDFERVWSPIKRCLWPEVDEHCLSAEELQWFEDKTEEYSDMLISTTEDCYRQEFLSYI